MIQVHLEIPGNRETLVQLDQLDKEGTLDKEETLVLMAIQELRDLKVRFLLIIRCFRVFQTT